MFNNATNIGVSGNTAEALGGTGLTKPGLSSAFNIGGTGNSALATNGPFAIAGNVGGTGRNTVRNTTGINIK